MTVKKLRVIIVMTNSWVFVGTLKAEQPSDDFIDLQDAACIRIWGTEHGLGQLALNGATAKTVLDPCGDLRCCRQAVLFQIPVISNL